MDFGTLFSNAYSINNPFKLREIVEKKLGRQRAHQNKRLD